jgi:hypothetical protein
MNIPTSADQGTLPVRSLLVVTLVGTLCFGAIVWHHARAKAELTSMPAQERYSLYERTLSTLHTTCSQVDGEALQEFCKQQAEFVSRLPECDASCLATCQRYLPRPTR